MRPVFFGDGVLCIYPNRADNFDQSVVRITGDPFERDVPRVYRVEKRDRDYRVTIFTTFADLKVAIRQAEEWAEE